VLLMFLCRLGIQRHPCQKQPRYPGQMHFPPITGVNNFACPSHIRQPLKTFNRLTIPHTVTGSRDNTYSIRFQEHGSEYPIANGRYCNSFPKGSILTNFKNKFRNAQHACLNTFTSSMQYASISSFFKNNLPFCSSYHCMNCVRSSADKVCPVKFGFRIRTHIL